MTAYTVKLQKGGNISMKKLFPVILATSACLGLLTACGGGSTSAGSDTAGSGSTGETYELKFASQDLSLIHI